MKLLIKPFIVFLIIFSAYMGHSWFDKDRIVDIDSNSVHVVRKQEVLSVVYPECREELNLVRKGCIEKNTGKDIEQLPLCVRNEIKIGKNISKKCRSVLIGHRKKMDNIFPEKCRELRDKRQESRYTCRRILGVNLIGDKLSKEKIEKLTNCVRTLIPKGPAECKLSGKS